MTQMPMKRNEMLALATLIGGLGAAAGIVLLSLGRTKEVYTFAMAGAVVGAFLGAAKALETGEASGRIPL